MAEEVIMVDSIKAGGSQLVLPPKTSQQQQVERREVEIRQEQDAQAQRQTEALQQRDRETAIRAEADQRLGRSIDVQA